MKNIGAYRGRERAIRLNSSFDGHASRDMKRMSTRSDRVSFLRNIVSWSMLSVISKSKEPKARKRCWFTNNALSSKVMQPVICLMYARLNGCRNQFALYNTGTFLFKVQTHSATVRDGLLNVKNEHFSTFQISYSKCAACYPRA